MSQREKKLIDLEKEIDYNISIYAINMNNVVESVILENSRRLALLKCPQVLSSTKKINVQRMKNYVKQRQSPIYLIFKPKATSSSL